MDNTSHPFDSLPGIEGRPMLLAPSFGVPGFDDGVDDETLREKATDRIKWGMLRTAAQTVDLGAKALARVEQILDNPLEASKIVLDASKLVLDRTTPVSYFSSVAAQETASAETWRIVFEGVDLSKI